MITSDRKQSQTSHRFKAFEELKNSPDVPLLPLPNLQVFLEDSAARRNITHDPTFNTILTQIKLVLYHLIASEGAFTDIRYIIEKIIQNVEAAKAALGRRLGSNREFVRQDLCNFLQRDTPAIIFKSTVLQSWNWGFVNKGEEVGAAENELFLSMDLMQALQNPATQDLLNISQDLLDQQKLRLSVLWKITFMHELMHATTKYFLSPEVITPNIPGLEGDGEGHGEAGWSLENWYLGYKLEAIWMKEDVEKPH
ncbi:hypothetical protein BDP27DRAFT_1439346 [Rhodocollybia butyracea]|uniref:Uncharacterized protein n=1 Tax=Rhodocollybia butyracea TaxID=206335 RepID=A0A9P5P5Z8_9AGAR|nr:hypothetical protein BDP27DRAFT_1439346 [Rhodocollybia butyracea]